jgi:hypothetical protein
MKTSHIGAHRDQAEARFYMIANKACYDAPGQIGSASPDGKSMIYLHLNEG